MNNRLKAYLALLLVSLIWGIASPVIKYTLNFLPPFTFLFWRFLVTCLIFLPIFVIFIRKHPIKIADLPKLIFLGFLGTPLTLSLIFVGYQKTTALDGVLISSTAPIFIALGGALFLKEKIEKKEKIGLLIALIGSIIAISQPLLEGGFLALKNLQGNLLVFGSVLSWTLFTLLSKEDFRRHHPFVITAFCFFIGLIVIFPFFLIEQHFSPALPAGRPLTSGIPFLTSRFPLPAILGILYMSLFSSVLAYSLYEYGLSKIEASEATLFAYLQPVFAAPVVLLWLGEKITFPFILGAFIIALGVLISEIKIKSLQALNNNLLLKPRWQKKS